MVGKCFKIAGCYYLVTDELVSDGSLRTVKVGGYGNINIIVSRYYTVDEEIPRSEFDKKLAEVLARINTEIGGAV